MYHTQTSLPYIIITFILLFVFLTSYIPLEVKLRGFKDGELIWEMTSGNFKLKVEKWKREKEVTNLKYIVDFPCGHLELKHIAELC